MALFLVSNTIAGALVLEAITLILRLTQALHRFLRALRPS